MGEGTYSHTHVFDSILEEFGFLSYEEKHYLCRTNFDYDTKLIDGVDIFLYTDGVLADAVGIRNQIVEYQKETVGWRIKRRPRSWRTLWEASVMTSSLRSLAGGNGNL